MTEQEYRNRPSDVFISEGIVYTLSTHSGYNPVTRSITYQIPGIGIFPMAINLIEKFLSIDENPEEFL